VLPSHVTVRGASIASAVLRADGVDGALLQVEPGAEGVAIEDLTVQDAGVELAGEASFCIVRRVRCRAPGGVGVALGAGEVHHVWVEQVTVEDAGDAGLEVGPGGATSVFVTELSVVRYGGGAGLRIAGRVHLNQVHVEVVGADQVGFFFDDGSDHSTLSNFYVRLDGGEATRTAPGVQVAVGVGAIQ
jgi:hypothetical protein